MKKIEFITKIVEYVLLIIGAILVLAGFTNSTQDAIQDGSATDLAIMYTGSLLAIGFFGALIALAVELASDTKRLIKAAIFAVALLVVLVIFWNISDATPLPLIGYEGDQNQGAWLKLADTGIFCAYLALGGAVVSIIVTEIYQLFR